ncbi:MAG: hypothetical protein J3K34DRAFT_517630 [Monoraphidium minutum]|nr:MAG: hypothetical protein J3K34DRAFT_517630 [Monoraphidium minutum]
MAMHSAQSRTAWTEQEDDLLRAAVKKYGDRAWAMVAHDVPGRSSKSCSDRWRNFLSPDIEHPRKSPFSEWEVAVVVQAQHRYGNNWKAISMLLPGRTNRAVKNLFVGNLKWGARLPEIQNRYLEAKTPLEDLLEVKPDYAGGPPKDRPGLLLPPPHRGGGAAAGLGGGALSPGSGGVGASTSSAGSGWASDLTDHHGLACGLPGLHGQGGHGGHGHGHGGGSPSVDEYTPKAGSKRRRRGSNGDALAAAPGAGGQPQPMGDALAMSPLGMGGGGPMALGMAGAGYGVPLGACIPLQACGMPVFGAPYSGPLLAGPHGGYQMAPPPPHDGHLATVKPEPHHGYCAAPSAVPGAPPPLGGGGGLGGLGAPLPGQHSADSMMLAQIMGDMDQILEDDDDVLSDPAMSKEILGSPTSSPLLAARGGGGSGSGGGGGEWAAGGWGGAALGGGFALQAHPAQRPQHPQAHQQLPPRTPTAPAAGGAWWAPPGGGAAAGGDAGPFCHPSRRVSTDVLASPRPGDMVPIGPPPALQLQGLKQEQPPGEMAAFMSQLQQDNLMLMQHVQSLQERLAASPAPGSGPDAGGGGGGTGGAAGYPQALPPGLAPVTPAGGGWPAAGGIVPPLA